jgi:hypothetical protein
MERFAALFLALRPLPAFDADFAARVVGITDGDTLTVYRPRRSLRIHRAAPLKPSGGQELGYPRAIRV